MNRCELAEHHMRCEAIAAALRDEDELLQAVGQLTFLNYISVVDTPCFGLLVTSPWVTKPKRLSNVCCPSYTMIRRVTSGATPP